MIRRSGHTLFSDDRFDCRHSDLNLAHHLGAARSGRGVILQIGVTVHRDVIGSLKRLEIRRDIHVQKLPVNQDEAFGVGEAGKLGEVFRFDLGQFRGPDLGHAGGFVEREIARGARFLKFFAQAFHKNSVLETAKLRRRDRRESHAASRLHRAPICRAAPEYQRSEPRACNRAAVDVAGARWKRVFPVG